jgi:hypothetical protein
VAAGAIKARSVRLEGPRRKFALHRLFDRKKVLQSQYTECADIVLVERQGTLAKMKARIQLRA